MFMIFLLKNNLYQFAKNISNIALFLSQVINKQKVLDYYSKSKFIIQKLPASCYARYVSIVRTTVTFDMLQLKIIIITFTKTEAENPPFFLKRS